MLMASSYHDATDMENGDRSPSATPTRANSRAPDSARTRTCEYPEWVGPMHSTDEGIFEETLRRTMPLHPGD